ncbi:unnamed protein product, partial [Staurois parvus]
MTRCPLASQMNLMPGDPLVPAVKYLTIQCLTQCPWPCQLTRSPPLSCLVTRCFTCLAAPPNEPGGPMPRRPPPGGPMPAWGPGRPAWGPGAMPVASAPAWGPDACRPSWGPAPPAPRLGARCLSPRLGARCLSPPAWGPRRHSRRSSAWGLDAVAPPGARCLSPPPGGPMPV